MIQQAAITRMKLADIRPAPYNPRIDLKPGDPQYEALRKSLERWGLVETIVVNRRSGHLVGGHQRLKILQQAGVAEADVSLVDLGPDDEKALNIALNSPALAGEYDDGKLAGVLQELQAGGYEISLTGFGPQDLDRLLADLATATDAADGEPPTLQETAITRPGDIWLLGRHRLLCGDGTDVNCLRQLLGATTPVLLITSPPYNQGIDKFHPSGMHKEHAWVAKVASLAYPDSRPEGEYQQWQKQALDAWYVVLADNASIFYNHKNRYREKRMISPMAWLPGPFNLRQEIVWIRPGSVTQNARMFLPSDERVFWLYKGENFAFRDTTEIKSHSTVWEIALEANLTHAAAFPLELPSRPIIACSDVGDVVLEPFAGSGTTIIAAERLGRTCYAVEIEPLYCDVAIRRWQTFTDQKACREDGTPFPD